MKTYTGFLNLEKHDNDEFYDIFMHADNMDKVDAFAKIVAEGNPVQIISGDDLNDFIENGTYLIGSPTGILNLPSTSWGYSILVVESVLVSTTRYIKQSITRVANSVSVYRKTSERVITIDGNGANVSDWAQIATVDQVSDITAKIIKNISILSASWVDDTGASGFWYYDYSNAEIDSNSVVDVNIDLLSLDDAGDIRSTTESFVGYVRLYADAQPAVNIAADVIIQKGVV